MHEGPEFSLVPWQKILMDVVEAEQSSCSSSIGEQIVKWSEQGHPGLPFARTYRFEQANIQVMNELIHLATKPFNVNTMYPRLFLETLQCPLKVPITTTGKIQMNLARSGSSQGSDGSLRTLTLELFLCQFSPWNPFWKELVGEAPDVL